MLAVGAESGPKSRLHCLHWDIRIVKNAVQAVLPEHCDDDGPCDLPYRLPGRGELIDLVGVAGYQHCCDPR